MGGLRGALPPQQQAPTDRIPPPSQEEEALERAQATGQAASGRAGRRMAEQWLQLSGTPEWRRLAARFPDAVGQLSAAGGGGGAGGQGAIGGGDN